MGALEKKLYILHGWTTDSSRWAPFLELLKKEQITPILLDIPGLTASVDKPWTLDDYVEWLYSTVHQDIKISVLGHSNGGRIALAFAAKYPSEIEQIFLMDAAGISRNDLLSKIKKGVFRNAARMGKKITNSGTAKNILYKLSQESDYNEATPIQKEIMKNLIKVDLTPQLKDIKTNVVIIWGKEDQITPYTDALIFKNALSNSSLFTIAGARHSPQFTNAKEVVRIIKEHIV